MEADITSQAVGLGSSVDFSLMSLFLRADFVVKSVIIILIAASIYSWAIIIEKFRMFKKINESTVEFEEKFWKSKSAESFYNNLIDLKGQLLHAKSLAFIHPSKNKWVNFDSELPDDFKRLLNIMTNLSG